MLFFCNIWHVNNNHLLSGRFPCRGARHAQRATSSSLPIWEVKHWFSYFILMFLVLCFTQNILPQNHCSLSWEDVVGRAAAVAKEGFSVSFNLGESNLFLFRHPLTQYTGVTISQNVTHLFSSSAEAVSKLKGEKLSQRFRDLFFPGGRPLSSGSFLRMPGLAAVLEAGLENFYDGNFSQEMVDVVNGVHWLNGLILWCAILYRSAFRHECEWFSIFFCDLIPRCMYMEVS